MLRDLRHTLYRSINPTVVYFMKGNHGSGFYPNEDIKVFKNHRVSDHLYAILLSMITSEWSEWSTYINGHVLVEENQTIIKSLKKDCIQFIGISGPDWSFKLCTGPTCCNSFWQLMFQKLKDGKLKNIYEMVHTIYGAYYLRCILFRMHTI